MPRLLFTPGKDTVPIVQEAGWTPGPVWTCAVYLTPAEIRPLYGPDRKESIDRLRAEENTTNISKGSRVEIQSGELPNTRLECFR
jgi:hypothetical protein